MIDKLLNYDILLFVLVFLIKIMNLFFNGILFCWINVCNCVILLVIICLNFLVNLCFSDICCVVFIFVIVFNVFVIWCGDLYIINVLFLCICCFNIVFFFFFFCGKNFKNVYIYEGNLLVIKVVSLVLGLGIVFILILVFLVVIINLYLGLLIKGNLVLDMSVMLRFNFNCLMIKVVCLFLLCLWYDFNGVGIL